MSEHDEAAGSAGGTGESAARAGQGQEDGGGAEGAGMLGYASGVEFPADAGVVLEAYQHEGMLVARHGSTLPTRCVLCGGPGHLAPVGLTFTWDSSFRVSERSTLELRKKAVVFAYLCAAHRRVWTRARWLGGIGAAAGLTVMLTGLAVGVWSESSDVPRYTPVGIGLTLAGFAGVIAGLFYFTLRSRTLACRRIEEGYLYLEGAAAGFVAALAPLPGKGEGRGAGG